MDSEGNGWFVKTVQYDGEVEFVFNDGASAWDNNNSLNYKTSLPEIWIKDGIIHTSNPTNTQTNAVSVTVHYKSGWDNANLHYNDGSGWTVSPGVAMES